MEKVTSADGTTIAFERSGEGDPLIIVGGALSDRETHRSLAAELPDHTVIIYDRRGRGDSSDTAPYLVEREVEDLAALIETLGTAAVYGHESGASLVLRAAADGLPINAAILHNAPLGPNDEESTQQVTTLLATGRHAEAAARFRGTPSNAHTLLYDFAVMSHPDPKELASAVPCPTLVVVDETTDAYKDFAHALPHGRHAVLHNEEALVPVVHEFLGSYRPERT
jgi:pimeloyl-ACP methyl ester carboxylesterase